LKAGLFEDIWICV